MTIHRILCLFFILSIVLLGCGATTTPEPSTDHAKHSNERVLLANAEVEEGDFVYRLYTTSDGFNKIVITAELTYVGEKHSIEIFHGDPILLFTLQESTRDVNIDMLIREIGATTTLRKNIPIKKKYNVSNGIILDNSKANQTFFEKLKTSQVFPHGEYTINGYAIFFSGEDKEHYTIQAVNTFTLSE